MVFVDHAALVRGHREAGESCEIAGVGEVPVSVVDEMLGDAFVRVILAKGKDASVVGTSRFFKSEVDAALRWRDRKCQVPGCVERLPLERDHVLEYAKSKRTSLDNSALLCRWHHRLKTTSGYRIQGRPGRRRWLGPDGRVLASEVSGEVEASREVEGRLTG